MLDAGIKNKALTAGGRNQKLLDAANAKIATDKPTLAQQEAQAQTGDALAHVAMDYAGYGEYPNAIRVFKAAIAKGGLTNVDEIELRLGVTQLLGGDTAGGQATLRQVKGKDGTGDLARYWLLVRR